MDNMSMMMQLGAVSDPNNMSAIDNLYKAFATGDIPTVLGTLDAKVEWNEAEGNELADGNPYIGHDAVLNGVFVRLGEDHEFFNVKNVELHEMSNNQVLATLRYDAKRKEGDALIDAQAAHLWTFKNGKVRAFQQYVDTKQLADAAEK
ncbi:MAG: nuclear transport factor 2 family protein [Saprospiraceae bacterium]